MRTSALFGAKKSVLKFMVRLYRQEERKVGPMRTGGRVNFFMIL